MPNTNSELRAFVFGVIAGIVMFVGAFGVVSYSASIKWQPVHDEWR